MSTIVLAVQAGLGASLVRVGLMGSVGRSSGEGGTGSGGPPGLPQEDHHAAAASEAVEALVNHRLSEIPELAGTRVDFGSAADGSLEIWIGDQRYGSVDEIPDPRIQEVVRWAVTAYNK